MTMLKLPCGVGCSQLIFHKNGWVISVEGGAEEYNLPASPDVPTIHLRSGWQSAAIAAGLMLAGIALAFQPSKPRITRKTRIRL